MKVVILENIRSAYNVWNIIRTADALWRNVWITGYTPSPTYHKKVVKTSLGAEENIWLKQFSNAKEAIDFARDKWMKVLAAEVTKDAKDLKLSSNENTNSDLAIIFWNEIDGVLSTTLLSVDQIVYIPMQWIKESLNVWQTAAIFMRAFS